jgi:hypothetical protein
MAKEKSLVEEAIIQMKNLEEAVAENAKGILASTMSQEIKELVKESLTEQDDEEVDTEVDMDDMDMDTDMDDTEIFRPWRLLMRLIWINRFMNLMFMKTL